MEAGSRLRWAMVAVFSALVTGWVVAVAVITSAPPASNRSAGMTVPALLGGRPSCPPERSVRGAVTSAAMDVVADGPAVSLEVPVCVDGRGPYRFLLDTGAGRSAVDPVVAAALHLSAVGAPSRVAGGACTTEQSSVAVAHWAIGGLALRPQAVLSFSLGEIAGRPVQGVLGSDVFSRFAAVRIDYRAATLSLLGPEGDRPATAGIVGYSPVSLPPSIAGTAPNWDVPLSVLESPTGSVALVRVRLGADPLRFILDTGASVTGLSSTDETDLRLPQVGRPVPLTTAGCRYDARVVLAGPGAIGGDGPLPGSVDGASVPLAPQALLVLPFPGLTGPLRIQGALGSDVLRRLGHIVIDYPHAALLVPAGARG